MFMWSVLLVLLITGVSSVHSAGAQVAIVKMPVNVGTKFFDPRHPPRNRPKEPFDAWCDGEFLITVFIKTSDPIHAEVTINQIEVTTQLNIIKWLPTNPSKRVSDHEDGHQQLSEEYYKHADSIARRIGEPYLGKVLDISSPRKAKVVLKKMQADITREYMRQMLQSVETTQDRFDLITDHSARDISVPEAVAQALRETFILQAEASSEPPLEALYSSSAESRYTLARVSKLVKGNRKFNLALAQTEAKDLVGGDFSMTMVDLDDDGKPEIIVQGSCRLDGCMTMVLRKDTAWVKVFEQNVVLSKHIGFTNEKSGGYHLLASVDKKKQIIVANAPGTPMHGKQMVYAIGGSTADSQSASRTTAVDVRRTQ